MISQSAVIIYDIFDRKSDAIFLKVTIGNGQTAGSTLNLSGVELESEIDSFELDMGSNKSLKGKTLHIVTTIKDIQVGTNKVTMDLELRGGKKKHVQNEKKKHKMVHSDSFLHSYGVNIIDHTQKKKKTALSGRTQT